MENYLPQAEGQIRGNRIAGVDAEGEDRDGTVEIVGRGEEGSGK